jgi:hypothetical protein
MRLLKGPQAVMKGCARRNQAAGVPFCQKYVKHDDQYIAILTICDYAYI